MCTLVSPSTSRTGLGDDWRYVEWLGTSRIWVYARCGMTSMTLSNLIADSSVPLFCAKNHVGRGGVVWQSFAVILMALLSSRWLIAWFSFLLSALIGKSCVSWHSPAGSTHHRLILGLVTCSASPLCCLHSICSFFIYRLSLFSISSSSSFFFLVSSITC